MDIWVCTEVDDVIKVELGDWTIDDLAALFPNAIYFYAELVVTI